MSKDWIHGEKRITWMWMLRDLLFRIVIYIAIPFSVIKLMSLRSEDLGLSIPTGNQMIVASILSLIAFVICLNYRRGSRKKRRLNPSKDFWFSLYLILVNSPTEEFFYRGFLLYFFGLFFGSSVYGLVISSIIFGLQHFLFFGASPKSVLFDTFGGFFLGFAYLYLGKSLITVILIHGVSNLALFTVGGYILNKWRLWET
jgi:membrane protease YdiL (CAAX protease family)